MSCKNCGKSIFGKPDHIRTYAGDAACNSNFCDKWCVLEYYAKTEPTERRLQNFSRWLQEFGRKDSKTGKYLIPKRLSKENKKLIARLQIIKKG
jgi:hypothetical protein